MRSGNVVIYLLRNKVNGKLYVGQTRQTWRKRWNRHVARALDPKCSYPIALAMRKHGTEAFSVSFIELCPDVESANSAEEHWIRHFNSLLPNGYNVTPGGVSQVAVADSVRKKISNHNRVRVHSEESKRKRRVLASGEGNPNRKLTTEKVREIRRLYLNGVDRPELARTFDVTFQCIDNIVKGKTWKSALDTQEED